MKNFAHELLELIKKQLGKSEYELMSVIPIPSVGDRLRRLRELEEVIAQLKNTNDSFTEEYVIQIRPKVSQEQAGRQAESRYFNTSLDGIYLNNGKLNIPFLLKNADLLFDSGEYHSARKIYKTIQQSGECTALVLYKIGRCFEEEGRFNEAKIKYEESLAHTPSQECYQRFASILVHLDKSAQAEKILKKVKFPRRA